MDEFQARMLEVLGRIADELNELVNTQQKLAYALTGHDSVDPQLFDGSVGALGNLVAAVERMPVG